VQLSRDLITEYHNTHMAVAPKHKTSSIAQMAAKQTANQVTELAGWKTGDKCRTVWWRWWLLLLSHSLHTRCI
jgi:hypothetical protein